MPNSLNQTIRILLGRWKYSSCFFLRFGGRLFFKTALIPINEHMFSVFLGLPPHRSSPTYKIFRLINSPQGWYIYWGQVIRKIENKKWLEPDQVSEKEFGEKLSFFRRRASLPSARWFIGRDTTWPCGFWRETIKSKKWWSFKCWITRDRS